MENLKIYIQDCGVYGMIMVIVKSKEEAISSMKSELNYDPSIDIQSFDIQEGFQYANWGDS